MITKDSKKVSANGVFPSLINLYYHPRICNCQINGPVSQPSPSFGLLVYFDFVRVILSKAVHIIKPSACLVVVSQIWAVGHVQWSC